MIKYKLILILICFVLNVQSQTDTLIKFRNYKNILVFEGREIGGKREGEWKFYNDSLGYLCKIEHYKNDYPDGEFKEFNSSGKLILKGSYSLKAIKHIKKKNKQLGGYVYSYKALPVGELLHFDTNGDLIKKELYSDKGKLIKITTK